MIVSGGVSCNTGLQKAARQKNLPFPVLFPQASLSTDNAVMIAAAAFPRFSRNQFADFTLKAKANLSLA